MFIQFPLGQGVIQKHLGWARVKVILLSGLLHMHAFVPKTVNYKQILVRRKLLSAYWFCKLLVILQNCRHVNNSINLKAEN